MIQKMDFIIYSLTRYTQTKHQNDLYHIRKYFDDFELIYQIFLSSFTAWKVSVFGVFLVGIFPHSDWIWENMDQKNSEYGHFSRSVYYHFDNISLHIQGTENTFPSEIFFTP